MATLRQYALVKPRLASRWSNRFIWAAILNGFVASFMGIGLAMVILTMPSVVDAEVATILRTPAAGFVELGALTGFLLYITVGVIGSGVTAQVYRHFEIAMGKAFTGVSNTLAWAHLVSMNVGIAGAAFLMIYAGFIGDSALFPTDKGGLGWTVDQVWGQTISPLVGPIAVMILLTATGVMLGGVGYIVAYRRDRLGR